MARASAAGTAARWLRLPNLVHLGTYLRDFADTAAIIALLDVVISVDTAVAHLAGALKLESGHIPVQAIRIDASS